VTVARVGDRRVHLAQSALEVLSELGYAHTGVRDIAQRSSYSHGVLHYYFKDKSTLILEAVRLFKNDCIARYDAALEDLSAPEEVLAAFEERLTHSVEVDGSLHRLWYDVRAQGYFGTVDGTELAHLDGMIEAMVLRFLDTYARLAGVRLLVEPTTAYALVDGLFQRALQEHFQGTPYAARSLVARVREALPLLLG
jgi:TetR/AcrR family transcriptional regulator, transcriptional repressor of bet genes